MFCGRWTNRRSSASPKRARALAALTLAASSCGAMSGCGGYQMAENSWQYNASWNNFVAKHRNSGMATKAWHRHKHAFCNEACLDQFCDGFRDGYLSVADGGDGCTPAFPPREYWGWQYQSAEGQRQVASWFSGFPHGARAAEEDGVGNWSQIQTSFGVQQNFDRAGLLGPGQRPGMYPMPEAIPPCAAVAGAAGGPGLPPGIPGHEAVIGVDPATGLPMVPVESVEPIEAAVVPAVVPAPAPQPNHSSSLPNASRLVR